MEYRNKIYNLLVNHQQPILEMLIAMGVENPGDKIKNFLDEQLFEIVECNESEILKIRKKSTGEIFGKGCKFYSTKHKCWIEGCYFNWNLTGYQTDLGFYKNYVMGQTGLYHLNEISLTNKEVIRKSEFSTRSKIERLFMDHSENLLNSKYNPTKYDYNMLFDICFHQQELIDGLINKNNEIN